MVKVPSLDPTQRIVGASGVRAERDTTSMESATRKADSRPIPNCPRKSRRAIAKSSRFDVLPIIESRLRMSSAVSPMPLSRTISGYVPHAGSISMRPSTSWPSSARAVTASRAFCTSSRRYTRSLL
jgi:hypothetical protein